MSSLYLDKEDSVFVTFSMWLRTWVCKEYVEVPVQSVEDRHIDTVHDSWGFLPYM